MSNHSDSGNHYYFDIAAVLVTLVYVGKYIEAYVSRRATNVLNELSSIEAKTAILKEGNKEVLISDLKIHDIIIVKPKNKIPIDGVIFEGNTTIDQSVITGEFLPIIAKKGSNVIGGTINLSNEIEVSVSKLHNETMIAQIINTVEVANFQKIKVQKIADKIAGYFIPSILMISLLALILWMTTDIYKVADSLNASSLLYPGQILGRDFISAMTASITILVISCPCALGIATPLSVLIGSTKGAKNGILFKSPSVFEKVRKIKAICFDKTGTLTIGKPVVSSFFGEEKYLPEILAIEKLVSHPIAYSIIDYCNQKKVKEKISLKINEVPGLGVEANINERAFAIGSLSFMKQKNVVIPEEMLKEIEEKREIGDTLVIVSVDGIVVCFFSINDEIRHDSKEAISSLRKKGYEIYMITGDHESSAKKIAAKLGIEKYYFGVLPNKKYEYVKKIQESGKQVAFVGDGINDAPALVQSDLGIAMGGGTAIAISASDVVIMDNNLSSIENVIILSRRTLRNIYTNLA
jgi:Cu+-exporting ATPase